jgi:LmbE family N-acetylglucosaminyl deacetylase
VSTVVFLHAHPDDETIFTGGTIAALADAGHRVVVVFATDGRLGLPVERDVRLQAVRTDESHAAGAILGVARVVFLEHADSGLDLDALGDDAFAAVPVASAAAELEAILLDEGAEAIVTYDVGGIYPHPDHLHVHRVARAAAAGAGTATVYEATVDREHLHFVETHLVVEASGAVPGLLGADPALRMSAWTIGSPTVIIDLSIDVRPFIDRKRAAMAAHASQITGESSARALDDVAFAEVYGTEWYLRSGPPGPLDTLAGPS